MKLNIATVFLLASGFFVWRFFSGTDQSETQIYFYDLSAKKLFAASRDSVPPIPGVDGPDIDGVRAVVFSPSGKCGEDNRIAFLEKYSPELKMELERAKANHNSTEPRMSRGEAQGHTFVKRIEDLEWTAINAEAASAIVGGWRLVSPANPNPTICLPE